jgi:2'-5' RNA ligase
MHIPITHFGNVTLGDSMKLADALRAKAGTWSRPVVRFAGAAALEFPGDESVWATLAGDVEGLKVVGRGVPEVVKRLGFFVDRRVFRPWLSVGTITDDTTAPYLERLVAAIEGLEGRSWTVDAVWLMRRPAEAVSSDAFEEMERMPLAEG